VKPSGPLRTTILVAVAALAAALHLACSAPMGGTAGPRAAIVDSLYISYPNETFLADATNILQKSGFAVDLYLGDDVTVDLYRGLPSHGYELIVLRAHSGLESNGTWLLTSETYSRMRHIPEQLSGQLAKAMMNEQPPWVFTVGARFISQSLKGRFADTCVIMMGCYGYYFDDLAQALVEKGATTFIAWDGTVDLSYVDAATITLLRKLFQERLSVRAAVGGTMRDEGPDPDYRAVLRYFPPESRGMKPSVVVE